MLASLFLLLNFSLTIILALLHHQKNQPRISQFLPREAGSYFTVNQVAREQQRKIYETKS